MKNFTLSVATAVAMSTFAVAGGDIEPVVAPVEEVAPAPSTGGFYIGGALSLADIDSTETYSWDGGYDGYTEEVTSAAYMLQAGYEFNEYIAVEGRYWGSFGDVSTHGYFWENGSVSDGLGDFSAWGVYVKPMYPVTEALDVYALLGYGNTSLEYAWSNPGGSGTYDLVDENGFQWGIGASYSFTDNTSFFVDYVQLIDGEGESEVIWGGDGVWNADVSIYTLNVGISYKF